MDHIDEIVARERMMADERRFRRIRRAAIPLMLIITALLTPVAMFLQGDAATEYRTAEAAVLETPRLKDDQGVSYREQDLAIGIEADGGLRYVQVPGISRAKRGDIVEFDVGHGKYTGWRYIKDYRLKR